MLDEFEKAVFAMQAGQISQPVRTEVGWHVIECVDRLPLDAEPLSHVYVNVASDAAEAKAVRIAMMRADSLLAHVRTVEDARRVSDRNGIPIYPMRVHVGETVLAPSEAPYIRALEKMKPGELYPAIHEMRGIGYSISWVEQFLPPPPPTWEEAKPRALSVYRAEGSRRVILAKQAEIDSLLRAGWSFDSLGVLQGGLDRDVDLQRGGTLKGLGKAPAAYDSLLFGSESMRPALEVGMVSDWVTFTNGRVRMRVEQREPPLPAQVDSRMASLRRNAAEAALRAYYEDLKARYPVKILDPKLRTVALPEAPPPSD
jgi:hypothetical protein